MNTLNEKIDEILENTKLVKEKVIQKPKPKQENEKTAKQKAEAKFKMVGTKLNKADLLRFSEILEKSGKNQSQFIKGLIFDKTEKVSTESDKVPYIEDIAPIKQQNEAYKAENKLIKEKLDDLNTNYKVLEKENTRIFEALKLEKLKVEELERYKNLSIFIKFVLLFKK